MQYAGRMNLHGLPRRLYRLLPRPPSTNYLYRTISPNPLQFLPPNAVIFDIGSKDAKGSYAFGSPPQGAQITCVDIAPGPGVDLVADIHDMHMVTSGSVDFVTSVSVLEHVKNPQQAMKEIFRILKPGGIVYVNVPFIFPFHADPDDFYRFTYKGIDLLCDGFERIDSGFNRGPASTMVHLMVHFMAMLFSFNSRMLYGVNVDLFTWMLFWVKYLDKFLARYQMAYVIHAGSYFIGRKP
jgi:SAM-dependent methyltransferase